MEHPLPQTQLYTLIDLITRRAPCPLVFYGTLEENPRQWLGYLEDQLEALFTLQGQGQELGRSKSVISLEDNAESDDDDDDARTHTTTTSTPSSSSTTSKLSIPLSQWPYVAVSFLRGEILTSLMRGVMDHFTFGDTGVVWNEEEKSWERESSTSRKQRLRREWEKFGEVLCELHGGARRVLAQSKTKTKTNHDSYLDVDLGTAYLQAASESCLLEELGIPRPIPPIPSPCSSSSTLLSASSSSSPSPSFSSLVSSTSAGVATSTQGFGVVRPALLPIQPIQPIAHATQEVIGSASDVLSSPASSFSGSISRIGSFTSWISLPRSSLPVSRSRSSFNSSTSSPLGSPPISPPLSPRMLESLSSLLIFPVAPSVSTASNPTDTYPSPLPRMNPIPFPTQDDEEKGGDDEDIMRLINAAVVTATPASGTTTSNPSNPSNLSRSHQPETQRLFNSLPLPSLGSIASLAITLGVGVGVGALYGKARIQTQEDKSRFQASDSVLGAGQDRESEMESERGKGGHRLRDGYGYRYGCRYRDVGVGTVGMV